MVHAAIGHPPTTGHAPTVRDVYGPECRDRYCRAVTASSNRIVRRRLARRGVAARLGRWLDRGPVVLCSLLLMIVVVYAVRIMIPGTIPFSLYVVPVLLGGFALSVPSLLVVVVVTGVALVGEGVAHGVNELYLGVVFVVAITAVVAFGSARSRARLGVQGTVGESMLVDLRDRLRAQGEMPELPRGWQAEVVHRSAGRSTFSGDFLVASRSPDGLVLEVALVDVSGKGLHAGTRALLLSGAFGGLIGSLPPAEFLPAANAYLLRQEWAEGFATAVYLIVDLGTGRYQVRSAGHPPAVHFHAGSGQWRILEATGGLLGVFEKDDYVPAEGALRPGDALLLFTDGMVESRRRDLTDGIDKLQGEAERLVARGFRNGARRLIDAVASSDADDRALILLWRT